MRPTAPESENVPWTPHHFSTPKSMAKETLQESDAKLRATKISISMPESMVDFIDEQCTAFRVGRSTYLQMLLEAEQETPRREFIKRAQG